MSKWKVLQEGEDCWHEDDEPMRFRTKKEAEEEIQDVISDVKEAIEMGNFEEDHSLADRDSFEIVKA